MSKADVVEGAQPMMDPEWEGWGGVEGSDGQSPIFKKMKLIKTTRRRQISQKFGHTFSWDFFHLYNIQR